MNFNILKRNFQSIRIFCNLKKGGFWLTQLLPDTRNIKPKNLPQNNRIPKIVTFSYYGTAILDL